MLNWIAKLLIPSPKKLSALASQACQAFINQQPEDRAAQIARASDVASRLSDIQGRLSKALADGKLDDEETAKLAEMLEPVVRKILSNVKENM